MSYRVKSAEYLISGSSWQNLADYNMPEIALVGRSNSGKSTLINILSAQKKLARTSQQPGRTQQINLFKIALLTDDQSELNYALVDLPGFGFAKVSKEQREEFCKMSLEFVSNREQLRVLLLLNDCRRSPQDDELALYHASVQSGVTTQVVLTKLDKLSKSESKAQVASIAAAFGLQGGDVLLSSSQSKASDFWPRLVPLLS